MNVGHERQGEGAESDRHGRMPCRWPGFFTKSKVLIGYVSREYDGTDDKGGQPPKESHLIGRSRPGKCGRCNTNGEVEHADQYHCEEPSLSARVVHTSGFNHPSSLSRHSAAVFACTGTNLASH